MSLNFIFPALPDINLVRGCKLNFWREKKFIGVSETKSWEKSRSFKYGSSKDFLSKRQKNVGGGVDSTPQSLDKIIS